MIKTKKKPIQQAIKAKIARRNQSKKTKDPAPVKQIKPTINKPVAPRVKLSSKGENK